MVLTDVFCAQNSECFDFKLAGGSVQAYNDHRILNSSENNLYFGSQKKPTLNCYNNHIFRVQSLLRMLLSIIRSPSSKNIQEISVLERKLDKYIYLNRFFTWRQKGNNDNKYSAFWIDTVFIFHIGKKMCVFFFYYTTTV
jgi:hypothetical protein